MPGKFDIRNPIFHDDDKPREYLEGLHLMASSNKSFSGHELHRVLGTNYEAV